MRSKWHLSAILLSVLLGCKQEVCDNNVDDNGDGATDCDDSTCSEEPACGPRCGNVEIDAGEQCDGTNLNNQTCEGFGFDSGVLSCNSACQFDQSACVAAGVCGDNQIDAGEDCDGNNLNGASCISVGLEDGVLDCNGICEFDTSGCGNGAAVCGNNIQEGTEECDDGNLVAGDGCSSTCTSEVVLNGALVINEVDYDQLNSDTATFVEIFNGTNATVSLVGLSLAIINGADGLEGINNNVRIDLSSAGSLAAGQFLVVGNDSVISTLPGAVKTISKGTTDFLQNGGNAANPAPDGVLLLDANDNIIDALSYEGSIANFTLTGGSSTPFPGTGFDGLDTNGLDTNGDGTADTEDFNSVSRNTNGVDTNNGNADWSITTPGTPGAANP